MLVGCLSINSSTATLNAPTGMSQVVETGERRFEVDDALQAGSGPTGARTWTFSASREWSGWLVGLRPQ
jgi:hypothetical protein